MCKIASGITAARLYEVGDTLLLSKQDEARGRNSQEQVILIDKLGTRSGYDEGGSKMEKSTDLLLLQRWHAHIIDSMKLRRFLSVSLYLVAELYDC